MDQLSGGYLEYASESPYSVQNMANIRIRLIVDSSNILVNRLGPSRHSSTVRYLPSPCAEMPSLPPKSTKVSQQNNVVRFKNN